MNYSTYNSLNSNTNKDIQEIVSSYVHLLSILYYIRVYFHPKKTLPEKYLSQVKKKRKEIEKGKNKICFIQENLLQHNIKTL